MLGIDIFFGVTFELQLGEAVLSLRNDLLGMATGEPLLSCTTDRVVNRQRGVEEVLDIRYMLFSGVSALSIGDTQHIV